MYLPTALLYFCSANLLGRSSFHCGNSLVLRECRLFWTLLSQQKSEMCFILVAQMWMRRMKTMRSGRKERRSWLTAAQPTRDPAPRRLRVTSALNRSGSELDKFDCVLKFISDQPCQCSKYTTLLGIQKCTGDSKKELVTHAESHAGAVNLL